MMTLAFEDLREELRERRRRVHERLADIEEDRAVPHRADDTEAPASSRLTDRPRNA